MNEGYVYILSNPVMPGLVKIGFTTHDDINVRLSNLFTTGVPVPFEVEYACRIPDCQKVEKALHRAFQPQRVHIKREFFEIEANQAIAILELFEAIDLTTDVIHSTEDTVDQEDRAATARMKKRRPNMNFLEIGLKIGDSITFIPSLDHEEPITAEVHSSSEVVYHGEAYSLTGVTKLLLGLTYNVQPSPYWTSEKGRLIDLYEETY